MRAVPSKQLSRMCCPHERHEACSPLCTHPLYGACACVCVAQNVYIYAVQLYTILCTGSEYIQRGRLARAAWAKYIRIAIIPRDAWKLQGAACVRVCLYL